MYHLWPALVFLSFFFLFCSLIALFYRRVRRQAKWGVALSLIGIAVSISGEMALWADLGLLSFLLLFCFLIALVFYRGVRRKATWGAALSLIGIVVSISGEMATKEGREEARAFEKGLSLADYRAERRAAEEKAAEEKRAVAAEKQRVAEEKAAEAQRVAEEEKRAAELKAAEEQRDLGSFGNWNVTQNIKTNVCTIKAANSAGFGLALVHSKEAPKPFEHNGKYHTYWRLDGFDAAQIGKRSVKVTVTSTKGLKVLDKVFEMSADEGLSSEVGVFSVMGFGLQMDPNATVYRVAVGKITFDVDLAGFMKAQTRQAECVEGKIPSFGTEATDDAQIILSQCGKPSKDSSTAYDKPRPPMVTRIIEYRQQKLRYLFIPRNGKVGDPPPYQWKLVGITDMGARDPSKARVVDVSEAQSRMPCAWKQS